MKVPPRKPHFFKPIVPGFKRGTKIPVGFLKYLKGQEEKEHAVLRRAGKKWKVKLNGWNLEEGWEKFADEHDLQLGYILVFRYDGNMEFDVAIFDSSHCDTQYAEHLQEEEAHTVEETSKEFEFKGKGFHLAEDSTHNPIGRSHFECTIRSNYYLRVPRQFARENGLIDKKCGLIIRDEGHKSWNLRLYSSSSQVFVGGSWSKFCVANDLKVGDLLRFEVVTNGETPIWKVHASKANPGSVSSSNAFHHEEASTHIPIGQSHFECTLKSYYLSGGYLRVPQEFAKKNGLTNKKCGLIIRGEGRKSWNLKLYTSCSQVLVGGGLGEFCVANDLKVGDKIRFEVVTNGEKSIWKFQDMRGSPQVPTSTLPTSTPDDTNPHFISTFKPYIITYFVLYLPMDFAKSNGLINKTKIILVDEKQKSWPVRLRLRGNRIFIKRREWAKFMKANGVRVGDTYKFELISNGTIPVAYFHCNYSGKRTSSINEE